MEVTLVKCPECEHVINTSEYGPDNAAHCCKCLNIQLLFKEPTWPSKIKGFIEIKALRTAPIVKTVKI